MSAQRQLEKRKSIGSGHALSSTNVALRCSPACSRRNCQEIVRYYTDDHRFRSRIEMARYSFGQGEYKYFNYPLPSIVQQLRSSIYPHLAALANRWGGRLGSKLPLYPETLADFLDQCHRAGQSRPTPLLLKYGAGDFNCLHQDLYGDSVFPFQLTFFLSQRGSDFTGGEFVLAEQQPRRQSRVEVLLRAGRRGNLCSSSSTC